MTNLLSIWNLYYSSKLHIYKGNFSIKNRKEKKNGIPNLIIFIKKLIKL